MKLKNNIFLTIIICLLMIIPLNINAEVIYVYPGGEITKDYYFFEEGGVELTVSNNKNFYTINYAVFDQIGDRPIKDPYSVCLAISVPNQLKSKYSGYNYLTYYGGVKINDDGEWQKEDSRGTTVYDKCYDVWSTEKFYNIKNNINVKNDNQETVQSKNITIDNDNFKVFNQKVFKVSVPGNHGNTTKTFTNISINSVTATSKEIKTGKITNRYYQHYGNIHINDVNSVKYNMIGTNFNQCETTSTSTMCQLMGVSEKFSIADSTSAAKDIDITCTKNCPTISPTASSSGDNKSTKTLEKKDTTEKKKSKISLLSFNKEIIRIAKDQNSKLVTKDFPIYDRTTNTINEITLSEVCTTKESYCTSSSERKFFKTNSDGSIDTSNGYVEYVAYQAPKISNISNKCKGNRSNIEGEYSAVASYNNGSVALFDFNTYKTNSKGTCTRESSDTALYPVYESKIKGHEKDLRGDCCFVEDPETGKCQPIYTTKKVNSKWEKLIRDYNADKYRDPIDDYRCLNGIKYNIIKCEYGSNGYCKYKEADGSESANTIGPRKDMSGGNNCTTSIYDPEPATPAPANPGAGDDSTKSELEYGLTEVNVSSNGKYEFKVGRKISTSKQAEFANGADVLKTGALPALIVYEHTKECEVDPQKLNLTCSKPQGLLESGTNGTDCDQLITSESSNNQALIHLEQSGVLKVNLNNNYIKSGESFTFNITYEDTISWNKTYGTIDDSIREQAKFYIAQSELFTNLSFNVKYEYNTSTKEGLNLDGRYKYKIYNGSSWEATEYTDGEEAGNRVADLLYSSANGTSGKIKVKVIYELVDAWSNPNKYGIININGNKINYAGVYHLYTNNEQDTKIWTNEGKRFYTRLDTESSTQNIHADIKGLSGIKYQGDTPFWQADYNCDVTCIQEFFDGLGSGEKKGFKPKYREIDNNDPFPLKINPSSPNLIDSRIGIDANWITWATAIAEKNTQETGVTMTPEQALNSKIVNRLSKTYTTTPEYIVEVNLNGIENIRNYNGTKNPAETKLENNYFDGVKFSNNETTSAYIDKYLEKNDIRGLYIRRDLDMLLNKVGYCGDTRELFINYNKSNQNYMTTIEDTDCFCFFVDSSGQCIYNKVQEGVGE